MALQNAFGDLALDASVSSLSDEVVVLQEQNDLLRRLIKLMESQATIDSAQRQRITLDSITSGVTLPTVTTVGTVNTVTGVTTVSTVSSITAATTLNQFAGVDLRFQWIENARIAYNTGIRSKLTY